jgi:hypothetical protein
MDPNYDDWKDFYGEECECRFAESVLNYIRMEWEVSINQYPPEIQGKALVMIEKLREAGSNIPNTASKIAMEVLPL